MSSNLRRVSHFAALAAAASFVGCSGSADLDKQYGLNDPANQGGPGMSVARLIEHLQTQLRGREVPPKVAIAETQENMESYQASQFGDKAPDFDKLVAGLNEMKQMADQGKPKAQLQEKAEALKGEADKLAAAPAG